MLGKVGPQDAYPRALWLAVAGSLTGAFQFGETVVQDRPGWGGVSARLFMGTVWWLCPLWLVYCASMLPGLWDRLVFGRVPLVFSSLCLRTV